VPTAYRVLVSPPMEAATFPRTSDRIDLLVNAINITVHNKWEEENRKRNSRPRFKFLEQLQRPFTSKPFRDPCILMSDKRVSPDFAYHSSIFLTDGAGYDNSGGTALYVDKHISNEPPRRWIRRGLLVDPSRGRLVVSSGGDENLRCKMPTRIGIRAVLQIWWACT
jgi:hypothetical protein